MVHGVLFQKNLNMAKRNKVSKSRLVLAFDLGGTKIATAVVDANGNILKETRTKTDLSKGPHSLIQALTALAKEFITEYPNVSSVGIASAGPLDPNRGVLLNPTNLKTKGKLWGKIQITAPLQSSLGLPVRLENDAAAALLGESWIGISKGIENVVMLTLGTGVGTSVICNGELVRAGRGLHTEGGHLIINEKEKKIRCGCGNYGDIEGYLSGNNFGRWAGEKYFKKSLTGEKIAAYAEYGDRRAVKSFEEYAHLLAVGLQNYIVLFAPEAIVFSGSFSNASHHFLKNTELNLIKLLKQRRLDIDFLPKLLVSNLENKSGIIGAAKLALTQ